MHGCVGVRHLSSQHAPSRSDIHFCPWIPRGLAMENVGIENLDSIVLWGFGSNNMCYVLVLTYYEDSTSKDFFLVTNAAALPIKGKDKWLESCSLLGLKSKGPQSKVPKSVARKKPKPQSWDNSALSKTLWRHSSEWCSPILSSQKRSWHKP